MPPKITEDLIDDVAQAFTGRLSAIADQAMAIPEDPDGPRCQLDERPAPWIAHARYFAEDGDTEPQTVSFRLCSTHADRFHLDYKRRRLVFAGRKVFHFALQQRP